MELERAFAYDGQHSLVRQLQANTGYRVTFQDFAMFLINNCFASVQWSNFRYSIQKLLELSSMNSTGWGGLDQQVNRIFDILDINRSGTLEVHEFGQLSTLLQQQWNDGSFFQMLQRDSGRIQRQTFQNFILGVLSRAFDMLDANKNGVIDGHEMQRLMYSFSQNDTMLMERARGYTQVRRADFYTFVLQEMMKDSTPNSVIRSLTAVIQLGGPNPEWRPGLASPGVTTSVEQFRPTDFETSPAPVPVALNDTMGSVMSFSSSQSPTRVDDFNASDFT